MPRPTRCRRIERLPFYRSFSPDDAAGTLSYDPDARCDHHGHHHDGDCGHDHCEDP